MDRKNESPQSRLDLADSASPNLQAGRGQTRCSANSVGRGSRGAKCHQAAILLNRKGAKQSTAVLVRMNRRALSWVNVRLLPRFDPARKSLTAASTQQAVSEPRSSKASLRRQLRRLGSSGASKSIRIRKTENSAARASARAATHSKELNMADAPVVHIGENSPEKIAYMLMERIADLEGRSLFRRSDARENADREYILSTYSECLLAAKQAYFARR